MLNYRGAMPYLYLALAMLLVGGNIPVGKAIVAAMPVFVAAGLRFLIASLILVPLGLRRTNLRLTSRAAFGLFLQALLGSFLFSVCMLYGVRYTTATSAGIITGATPIAIALLAWLTLGERVSRAGVVAIALSALGIVVVNVQAVHNQSAGHALLGNLLVFAAVISEACFAILSRRWSATVPPLAMATWVNVFGLVLFAPFAAWELAAVSLRDVSLETWGLVVFYAVSASVLAFLFWYRGVSVVAANRAGVFTSIMPLSATLVASVFLGERFTEWHAIGLILVLLAIAASTLWHPESIRCRDVGDAGRR